MVFVIRLICAGLPVLAASVPGVVGCPRIAGRREEVLVEGQA
jgi:hypothetical protein